jgi:hypothetical protein
VEARGGMHCVKHEHHSRLLLCICENTHLQLNVQIDMQGCPCVTPTAIWKCTVEVDDYTESCIRFLVHIRITHVVENYVFFPVPILRTMGPLGIYIL